MSISTNKVHQAISKLLRVLAGTARQQNDLNQPLKLQLELCMECAKTEASEGVALIEACAPHGNEELSQAQ